MSVHCFASSKINLFLRTDQKGVNKIIHFALKYILSFVLSVKNASQHQHRFTRLMILNVLLKRSYVTILSVTFKSQRIYSNH